MALKVEQPEIAVLGLVKKKVLQNVELQDTKVVVVAQPKNLKALTGGSPHELRVFDEGISHHKFLDVLKYRQAILAINDGALLNNNLLRQESFLNPKFDE